MFKLNQYHCDEYFVTELKTTLIVKNQQNYALTRATECTCHTVFRILFRSTIQDTSATTASMNPQRNARTPGKAHLK